MAAGCSGRLLDDAFDFAAVDAEFAGDGALAATGVVPCTHRLLQAWRFGQRGWCAVVRARQGVVHLRGAGECGADPGVCPDECREQFEGAGQRQRGPCADQGADEAVAQAVCQVGAGSGDDASTKAPARQGWYGPVAPVGVEDEHAGGQDQAVHGERDEPGGDAGLAVGADQFVGMAGPYGVT